MKIEHIHGTVFARRTALLIAIAAVHLGLISLFAQHAMARHAAQVVPITVALLAPSARSAEAKQFPALTSVAARIPKAALPEVSIASDAAITVVPATDNNRAAADTQASAPKAPTTDLPSMSEVAYLQAPKPQYPKEARLAHEEGLVILRVLIDEGGRVRDIEIMRSSGHSRLDLEARNAVAHAVFKPYSAGGIPHAAIALVPIEFSLRRS